MNETKITKERVRHHFQYGWWKYLLLAVVAVFGWSLVYTTTSYRPPKDKRLDVYFATYQVQSETLDWFREQILALFPTVEDANCVSVVYTPDDNYYGSMQLMTYIGAGEGDIYLLTKDRFDAYKESGAFVALDDAIASGVIDLRGVDVSACKAIAEETDKERVYGIPAAQLYGFMNREIDDDVQIGIDNRDLIICVMAYTHNQETAIECVDWLIETMLADRPEWLDEWEAQQQEITFEGTSDIPSY